MTFANVRPGGFLEGTRLTGAEVTTIDNNIVLALDTRGGSYAQSNPIVFNGNSWSLESLTVTGNATLGSSSADTLRVDAEATFYTSVVVTGGFYATTTLRSGTTTEVGTTLTVHGNSTLGDSIANTIVVKGTTEFKQGVSLEKQFIQTGASNHIETGGNLIASGLLNVTGTGVIDGNTTLGGTLSVTGGATISSGSSVPKRFLEMTDAPTTASWGDYNSIRVGGTIPTALSADRVLTLTSAGLPNGAEYEVWSHASSTTYRALITHNNGVAAVRSASGDYKYVKFQVVNETLELITGEIAP